MAEFLKYVAGEAAVILQAPLIFIAAAIAIGGLTFGAARWAFGVVIAHKDAKISALETMVKLRDDQLNNKFQTTTPEEAKALIAALRARVDQLTPLRIPKSARSALVEALRVPPEMKWRIDIWWDVPIAHAEQLGRDLVALFEDSGWEVDALRSFGDIPAGITLTVAEPPTASDKAAIEAVQLTGLPIKVVRDAANKVLQLQIGGPED
jgi:hypothetical protein